MFKCEMLDLDDMSKTGLQTGFPGAFRFLRDAAGAVSEMGWKAGGRSRGVSRPHFSISQDILVVSSSYVGVLIWFLPK